MYLINFRHLQVKLVSQILGYNDEMSAILNKVDAIGGRFILPCQ